jgi:hypothetical protein
MTATRIGRCEKPKEYLYTNESKMEFLNKLWETLESYAFQLTLESAFKNESDRNLGTQLLSNKEELIRLIYLETITLDNKDM